LEGSLSEAIESTYQLFPGILERSANLLFALKIREFIEMVSSANKVRHNATPTTTTGKYAKTADSSNGMLVDGHENQNGTTTTPKTNGNSAKAAVSEEDMGELTVDEIKRILFLFND